MLLPPRQVALVAGHF